MSGFANGRFEGAPWFWALRLDLQLDVLESMWLHGCSPRRQVLRDVWIKFHKHEIDARLDACDTPAAKVLAIDAYRGDRVCHLAN